MTLSFAAPPPPATRLGEPSADLILVGGVPGAGKTTAIAAATTGLAGVDVLDPEHLHRVLRDVLPAWLPYRAYRGVVHAGHTLAVLWQLLRGPVTGRRLVVHDPGTRRRRRLFLSLAAHRGWRVASVYVDVGHLAARTGQFDRGRALRPTTFEWHWDRWRQLRERIGTAGGPAEYLVERDRAATLVRRLCRPPVGLGA